MKNHADSLGFMPYRLHLIDRVVLLSKPTKSKMCDFDRTHLGAVL